MGAAVFGGFGAGVADDPDDLAGLEVAVLGELAEEAEHAVLHNNNTASVTFFTWVQTMSKALG